MYRIRIYHFNILHLSIPIKKNEIMRATVSHSEPTKIQVMTKELLKGQGVKKIGLKSNGETRYLLTQKAYDKISNKCTWIN